MIVTKTQIEADIQNKLLRPDSTKTSSSSLAVSFNTCLIFYINYIKIAICYNIIVCFVLKIGFR